jgi:hypothetical protein
MRAVPYDQSRDIRHRSANVRFSRNQSVTRDAFPKPDHLGWEGILSARSAMRQKSEVLELPSRVAIILSAGRCIGIA